MIENIPDPDKSLAAAMRERAHWLRDKTNSHMESGWGDRNSVMSALLEMADVIDSWSGEYLSKEDAEKEHHKRRFGPNGDYDAPALTMEERRKAVGK
jgi:hypothetical protein